jgi:hypothetical protein
MNIWKWFLHCQNLPRPSTVHSDNSSSSPKSLILPTFSKDYDSTDNYGVGDKESKPFIKYVVYDPSPKNGYALIPWVKIKYDSSSQGGIVLNPHLSKPVARKSHFLKDQQKVVYDIKKFNKSTIIRALGAGKALKKVLP